VRAHCAGALEADVARAVRLRTVPNLGERRSAVGRLVEPGLVRARLEPLCLTGRADHVVEATYTERRPDEDVVRVARIDHDLGYPAAEEGVVARNRARVRRVVDARIRKLRPVGAAVGRLVDADARRGAG